MSITNAFKRLGKTRCRITFTIRVQSLSISSTESLHVEDEVNVLFERGEKSVSTGAMSLSIRNGGMLTTTFNQTLTLDATMWRDHNGVYADKVGKLTVRQRKNNSFGGGYKILGMTFLQNSSLRWLVACQIHKTIQNSVLVAGMIATVPLQAPRRFEKLLVPLRVQYRQQQKTQTEGQPTKIG